MEQIKVYRNDRQAKILEIISRMEIETQEELCTELNKQNFNVTQATISRDIKDLKLYKVAGTVKKYKYASLAADKESFSPRMLNIFRECVKSIDYANNLIIVKTMSGNGPTAGMFIDSLQSKNILGCVAGDDTVLVIVDGNENTPAVAGMLKGYIS
ncbi:MAG: arginine repressor [Clostridia bacterium]|nr:arginine repressor [Clostridia bacterium]